MEKKSGAPLGAVAIDRREAIFRMFAVPKASGKFAVRVGRLYGLDHPELRDFLCQEIETMLVAKDYNQVSTVV